jgi:hypothetical protein
MPPQDDSENSTSQFVILGRPAITRADVPCCRWRADGPALGVPSTAGDDAQNGSVLALRTLTGCYALVV